MPTIRFIKTYKDRDGAPLDQPGLFTILEFENLDDKAVKGGYARIMRFNLWSFKKTRGVAWLLEHGLSAEEANNIIEMAENNP